MECGVTNLPGIGKPGKPRKSPPGWSPEFPDKTDLQLSGGLNYRGGMAHFLTTRRVEFCDTDAAGIIHFANYFRYMEQAEHEMFRELGLKIHGKSEDGVYGWPRVSATASFIAPAYYDDLLEVRLSIVRRGVRSLTTHYEFWRDDIKLATGEMKTAFCFVPEHGRLQSVDIPPDIAAPLDRLIAADPPASSASSDA